MFNIETCLLRRGVYFEIYVPIPFAIEWMELEGWAGKRQKGVLFQAENLFTQWIPESINGNWRVNSNSKSWTSNNMIWIGSRNVLTPKHMEKNSGGNISFLFMMGTTVNSSLNELHIVRPI